ncbi:hypothetical protein [Luteimonas aquatica]|uniref:hypothetical protein n=1 Tax=Luteimonas aquatica TaxID=450364 RepID=UPI001F564D47|nr:hypothetical protein [Luteimonas aquatica]
MQGKGDGVSRLRRSLALTAAGGLLLASSLAQAASFESYYGEKEWRDGGEDVKTVRYCEGGGSVTAGTRRLPDGSSEVLVVRADNGGAVLTPTQWTYRIADSHASSAYGIIELREGRGFALTGSVNTGDGSQIFVLQIGCDGKPGWTTLLGNRSGKNTATGYDLLQAGGFGKQAAPAGDIVVVGDELDSGGGPGRGRIARLDLGGGVLWDQGYDGPEAGLGLRFRAVAENIASSGAPTDLVVAGTAVDKTAIRRALMFRTDGGGAPVCNSMLGDGQDQRDFLGLTALRTANYAGETVAVGIIAGRDQAAPASAYLARYPRGSCTPRVQSVVSDVGSVFAYDLVETPDLGESGSALAVVGTMNNASAGTRGYLFVANIADLLLAGAQPRLYGKLLKHAETLLAIDRRDEDVLIAGSTFSDPENVGDAQDYFLVQTDSGMWTGCTDAWKPQSARTTPKPRSFAPRVERIQERKETGTPQGEAFDAGIACDPTKDCSVIDNGTVKLGVAPTGHLNVDCPEAKTSIGRAGTKRVGLRYMLAPPSGADEADAASPGCPCEGWGVAAADLGVSAQTSLWEGTSSNLLLDSFTYSSSDATSVVRILDAAGAPLLRVTHRYVPTPVTPYLYRVEVTFQNLGKKAINDLRYTRGIDYDVAPNAFSEYITISGAGSPMVIEANDNGFNSVNPLSPNSNFGGVGNLLDWGPRDLGAHFDFRLAGTLNAGQSRTLITYYGAAPKEEAALNALSLVGANIYSLGQSNWSGGPFGPGGGPTGTYGAATGEPVTFMYGVDGRER